MGVTKKIKVKAWMGFETYRCLALGIGKREFRALQSGREASIPLEIYKKYKKVFQEVKDGD